MSITCGAMISASGQWEQFSNCGYAHISWQIWQTTKNWYYSYFSQKTGFNISCKLSPKESFCMTCQSYFLLSPKAKKKKIWFSDTAASVQKVQHMWFFSVVSCFLTHENTWHCILLTCWRIISNQIAILTTNIWHSYLLAKKVGKLRSVYVVWDFKLADRLILDTSGCHFVWPDV